MKLETSRNVTKSKRSLHWCRSISKISVHVLLQYQSKSYYIIGQEVYYSIGRFYYIIGQLLQYRAFFITLSGSYYSIGRLLHYRLVQMPLLETSRLTSHRERRLAYMLLSFIGNGYVWQEGHTGVARVSNSTTLSLSRSAVLSLSACVRVCVCVCTCACGFTWRLHIDSWSTVP